MEKTFSIRVSGKVQGVFFRASTKQKADALGVKGFVKNERDGSVYIEASGEEQLMKDFISWCREGPPHANVIDVVVTEIREGDYRGFEIRRD